MKKRKGLVASAALGPYSFEPLTCVAIMYLFFCNGGCLVAICFIADFAVSPAVTLSGILSVQKRKYGLKDGILTLLNAASNIGDVLAFSAYSIALASWKESAGNGKPAVEF